MKLLVIGLLSPMFYLYSVREFKQSCPTYNGLDLYELSDFNYPIQYLEYVPKTNIMLICSKEYLYVARSNERCILARIAHGESFTIVQGGKAQYSYNWSKVHGLTEVKKE